MPLTIASNNMTAAGDHYIPTPIFSPTVGALRYIQGTINGRNKYGNESPYTGNNQTYCIYNSTTTRWELWFTISGEPDELLAESTSLASSDPWTATWAGRTCSVNITRGVDFIIETIVNSAYKGSDNIAILTSLQSATTAYGNVVLDPQGFTALSSGYENVCIGVGAGDGITTANSNVAIGKNAYTNGNFTTSTCLGTNSSVTGNSQVQLGGVGTTAYAYGAVQDRSDERDKSEIKNTELGLDFLNALRPVDFKWDMREYYRSKKPTGIPESATQEQKDAHAMALAQWEEDVKLSNITHDGSKKRNRFHHGLIAQEVKAVLDAKGIDFGGFQDHKINGGDDVLSIGYGELIGPMIKAIQELSAEVAALKAK
jgi:hypothetical protein